ncbi:MAG: T9SS type A sorting domain-containing protein [Bacteroidota bacterium]
MKTLNKTHFQLFFILLMQCLPIFIHAQVSVTFQKNYSGAYAMDGLDVIPAKDSGFIITGKITNDIINDMDIYIIKTNSTGDIQWTKTYGGNMPEYSFGILQATDSSGYFIIGYSQSFGGGDYDTWLLKIDNFGDTLWTKTYGTWGNDQGQEIIPTSDGNYVITGGSNSPPNNSYQAYLIKIDPDGDIIWNKYYGGPNYEIGNSVKQTPDGGYIMLGITYSYGVNGDAFLVKTNSTGDTLWTKKYGGNYLDEGIFIVVNSDSSYTFCVRDSSTAGKNIDVRIIKTDINGTIIWDKHYGGTEKDTDKMIQKTSDGGYIVSAITRSFGLSLPDMWILKLDSEGDTLWTRRFGGNDNEHCYSTRQTSDGGYIAVGKCESFSQEDGIMFLKLNSFGRLGTEVGINEIYSDNTLSIYPNPASRIFNIDFKEGSPPSTLNICNAKGQVIFSQALDASNPDKNKIIDLKDSAPGIYILTIKSAEKTITKKIILH